LTFASPHGLFTTTLTLFKMRFALNLFAALAAVATTALAQPTRRLISLNPSFGRGVSDVPNTGPITNAKRFAMHLPPITPKALRRRLHEVPRAPTRVQAAPRSESSPLPPSTTKCNILAKTVDGSTIGFLSAAFNRFGEYGSFQGSQDGALVASFSNTPGASSSQMDMYVENSPSSTYPFLGAIDGFSATDNDLGQGSYNYAYIGGTAQTAPGSPAMPDQNTYYMATGYDGDYESAIWSYDAGSQAITAQWINTDGSAPSTHILYANDVNQALVLTGDPDALRSAVAVAYPEVTFTCVPTN